MRATVLGFCAVVLSSCSLTSDEFPTDIVQTDQVRYNAQVTSEGLAQVTFDVPFVIRNTTGAPLYRTGCLVPDPAILIKEEEGEIVTAYNQAVFMCLGPPYVIEPGEVVRDTLHVWGALPGQNAAPTFDTEVEGTYRLYLRLYTTLEDDGASGDDLAPFEALLSNTFRVE